MASFEIRNLTFTYPARTNPALKDISLEIPRGQFVTFCGPSGCGKTTLLRQLKPVIAPHGELKGEILFGSEPLKNLDLRRQSREIGFVMQSPDNQIVTDKVWHELAFGLESLGYSTPEIQLRVAEMASFFGIQNWFHMKVTELSGGQKQLLNLASVMVMQPSVLILDEPTSQLDPIAASDFLAAVAKIGRELGVTIIMTEHRLEEVFPLSDRVICMDGGEVICDGGPAYVGERLRGMDHSMFLAVPAPMRIYAGVDSHLDCPITVRDGREWLSRLTAGCGQLAVFDAADAPETGEVIVEARDIWFRYEKEMPDVVKGVSLTVKKGEFICVLGGNGTGKTTALSLIGGIKKPYRGEVRLFGESVANIPDTVLFGGVDGSGALLGVLPQNPQALFVKKTIREDLLEILSGSKLSREERERRVNASARLCHIEELMNSHPYDLSGGEQQRAALAKVLMTRPKLVLLDEPTKGLDAGFKREFGSIIKGLTESGVTIVMVSHDVEFCAEYATRCAMFFDGNIVGDEAPREFFSGNSFYTTSANRMSRHVIPKAVTAEDVILALGGKVPERLDIELNEHGGAEELYLDGSVVQVMPEYEDIPFVVRLKRLSVRRKVTAFVAVLLFFLTVMFIIFGNVDFMTFISGGSEAVLFAERSDILVYVAVSLSLIVEAGVISAMLYPGDGNPVILQTPVNKRRLAKRTVVAAAMILLAIPLTAFIGIYYLDDRKYYFISMLIIIETILPFMLVFEGRKPQARELVVIAVLCAVGVAGRAAFFMLPQFKPVVAIVIISGVAFGGEAGFLVGAVTGFVSNMFFSQGPWTPWQMFSFGIIGFLAGLLFRKGLLRRGKIPLCMFGGLATFIIYGGIMDTSMVLMYQENPTWPMFLLTYLQGVPFNLVHAAATVTFLSLISRPMLEKLDRIKLKYGLAE